MMLADTEYELVDEGKSYVNFDEDLRLLMSPRNWQLQKRIVAGENSKEAGKVSWTSFRYYTSLESAIKDVIHIKTSKEFFNSATTMLEANKKVINDIKQALFPEYDLVKKG